jgi:hypothetical protein
MPKEALSQKLISDMFQSNSGSVNEFQKSGGSRLVKVIKPKNRNSFTGPFTQKEWSKYYEFEKNTHYWGSHAAANE